MKKRMIQQNLFFLFLLLLFLWGCHTAPPFNHAPTITSTPLTTAMVNIPYTYDVNATDPDGDTLTYLLDESPTGMTINSSTGLINWTPTPAQEGDAQVVVAITDGDMEVIQEFVINFQGTTAVLASISVLPETMFIQVGNTQTITSIIASYDTAADTIIPPVDCTYSSDDTTIATVAEGIITAVAAGSATITVSYTAGGITKTDTIGITVPVIGIIVLPVQNITQNIGYLSIQDALDAAHNHDTIQVAKGTYHESITFPSGKVIVLESIDGADATMIEGLNGSVTVTCNGAQLGTDIRGFTITHQSGVNGAGLYNTNGSVKITGCHIVKNTSTQPGGGIKNYKGTLTVYTSTISENYAEISGGGILNDSGTLNIGINSIISNNTSDDGGGICNYHGTMIITGESTVFANTAHRGGGIYNDHGTLTLTGKTNVLYNTSTLHHGGGIYIDKGTTTISGACTISENSAKQHGGGILIYDGTVTITGSTISANSADEIGGGIGFKMGNLTITGSTISENYGCGIYLFTFYPTDPLLICGGSNSADTSKFNHFINNEGDGMISAELHIRSSSSGDIHGDYPYNDYMP